MWISTLLLYNSPDWRLYASSRFHQQASTNMAMENGPCIGNFHINTSIHRRFSINMFDYQRVRYSPLHLPWLLINLINMIIWWMFPAIEYPKIMPKKYMWSTGKSGWYLGTSIEPRCHNREASKERVSWLGVTKRRGCLRVSTKLDFWSFDLRPGTCCCWSACS